jgi:site-specific DNA recombinase
VDEELWSAVQTRLAENRGTRRRARVETGALLGGAIFDDRGHIMSPTYSLRRGNRYRYYISSALLHDRKANAGSRTRVNADEIEQEAVRRLKSGLATAQSLFNGQRGDMVGRPACIPRCRVRADRKRHHSHCR